MNQTLPLTDVHYKCVQDYVEQVPDPDYAKAPQSAIDAFNDLKFAIRIHFGLYSVIEQRGESWPFLNRDYAQKAEYMRLIEQFNPVNFNAEEWMQLFERAGARAFAFTTKHHEGFSLFDTDTRVKRRIRWDAPGGPCLEECDEAFSVMETPFKRDMVRELCDAAHRHHIAIDLYFSHPDWYDADFAPFCSHPMATANQSELMGEAEFKENMGFPYKFHGPAATKETYERMMTRHRRQLEELLTRYGKIDMVCLDMWLGEPVWPMLRETIKYIRTLQPECMLRARGIGNYGDFYTPEGFVPGKPENTDMPWMVIHPLGRSFSYEKEAEHHEGAGWMVKNILECAAKGGSFMVGVGPDATGAFHPEAVRQLEETGRWLAANGRAVYATRLWDRERYQESFDDGSDTYYMASKDQKTIYAVSYGAAPHPIRLAADLAKQGQWMLLLPQGERPADGELADRHWIVGSDALTGAYGGDSFSAYAFCIHL